MPERSFGRTIRFRRTKLGLSQAKLGDLVGRAPATVRSWEKDASKPSDPEVLTALSAILGVEERSLFDKAGVELPPAGEEPTVTQALASLQNGGESGTARVEEPDRADPVVEETAPHLPSDDELESDPVREEPLPTPEPTPANPEPLTTAVEAAEGPGYVLPPEPVEMTAPTPRLIEPSYMEETTQRQLYRIRSLATLVGAVALGIVLLWALGEGLASLGDWWDEFFGNLRL